MIKNNLKEIYRDGKYTLKETGNKKCEYVIFNC